MGEKISRRGWSLGSNATEGSGRMWTKEATGYDTRKSRKRLWEGSLALSHQQKLVVKSTSASDKSTSRGASLGVGLGSSSS